MKALATIAISMGLLSTAALAQQSVAVPVKGCTYLRWGGPIYSSEWVCPNGVHYIVQSYWLSPDNVVQAKDGEGRCIFYKTDNVWICPPGFKLQPSDYTIVSVPGSN